METAEMGVRRSSAAPAATPARVERPATVSIGGGVVVPYPTPASAAASAVGRGNRSRGTAPEKALRSEMHLRGARFRKDYLLRLGAVRCRPDVVFTRTRVAVFVDGCFWHCCPEHFSMPRTNLAYWEPKMARNVARDRAADAALRQAGWLVLRFWEHEPVDAVAESVLAVVAERRGRVGAD